VLGGWQVNGITTFMSGTPFTVYDSAGVSVQGGAAGKFPDSRATGRTASAISPKALARMEQEPELPTAGSAPADFSGSIRLQQPASSATREETLRKGLASTNGIFRR